MRETLAAHLQDATGSFSIGAFGAIADFHRDAAEPFVVGESASLTVATTGGAIGVRLAPGSRPIACESPGKRPGWLDIAAVAPPHQHYTSRGPINDE